MTERASHWWCCTKEQGTAPRPSRNCAVLAYWVARMHQQQILWQKLWRIGYESHLGSAVTVLLLGPSRSLREQLRSRPRAEQIAALVVIMSHAIISCTQAWQSPAEEVSMLQSPVSVQHSRCQQQTVSKSSSSINNNCKAYR